MAKYKTKAEALAAVKLDGRRLYEVESHLKDDEEVVRTAIKHGGLLSHASIRLQNDTQFLLEEAYASPDEVQFYFDKVLFCAKRDWKLCQRFTQFYKKSDEFQIEMRLIYGDKYLSPIRKYNFMSSSELKKALFDYRLEVVRAAREIYVNGHDAEYITEHEDLYIVAGHSSLHWGAVSLREEGRPFSDIQEHFTNQIRSAKKEIESYCSEGLSGSYPERVLNSLLTLLGVDFAREQTFSWSTNVEDEDGQTSTKRYDFYIPSLSTIIEVHGSQHYDGGFENLGGRTLEQEQANDKQKEKLAKENGIEHYIVINALVSTLEYIKESIESNVLFTSLFDVSNISWDTVESGTVAKVKTDVSFPFFEEVSQRCSEWTEIINAALTSSDFVALPSIKEERKQTISAELIKNIENCHPSARGLYPHELLILSEAEGYRYPINPEHVPGKWFYEYDINDVSIYFNKLVREGFLVPGDIRSCVEHATLPIIKRILTEHNLSTKGRKAELVELLLNNVNRDELETLFTEKYLKRTPLGDQELADNSYICTKNRCGLSIWTLNRLNHAFPNDNIDTILLEYCNNPRRFLKYLSEDERERIGISYVENSTYEVPKYHERDAALNASRILQQSGKLQEALEKLLYIMLLDLSAPDFDVEEKHSFSYYFPYEKSLVKVAPGIVRMANKIVQTLGFSKSEIQTMLSNIIAHSKVASNIFTIEECVIIVVSELNEEHEKIAQIYRSAERRLKGNTKNDSATRSRSQPTSTARATSATPHNSPHKQSEPQNARTTPNSNSNRTVAEESVAKQPSVTRISTSRIDVKNTMTDSTPIPRKLFLVPACIFLFLTIMFFFVSMGQPNMWFGFACFAILSGMFFALAYSSKDSPYLFGKEYGVPKKLFVIICSIIAFLMPILSNMFS